MGRKALVTGGDSGIGAAVAIAFAKEGADVAIAYLPAEEEDARDVAATIEAAGRTAITLPGDLTDPEYRRRLAHEAAEALGGLDILVNNAGKQMSVERFEDLDDEQVRTTFEVNILAMFTVTARGPAAPGPGGRASSTRRPSRPTTRPRTCSTTRRPRRPSTTSPRAWACSWRPAASA